MDRRKFIKNTSLATAGITILNFPVFGKNAPSNKVVVAVMGVNSRGAYLAKSFSQLPNVEVAYICDVEEKAIANGLDALKDAPRKPTLVKDIRELVKKKDFDALDSLRQITGMHLLQFLAFHMVSMCMWKSPAGKIHMKVNYLSKQ